MHGAMGRPPLYGKRLLVAVDHVMLERLDAYRAQQPGLPNRSEAIRRLIMAAPVSAKPKPSKARR